MKALIRYLILLACCLLSLPALADTTSYVRLWSAFIDNSPITPNSNWLYGFLIEGRFTNQPGLLYQALLQGQLGYQATARTRLWLGYTWLPTTVYGDSGRMSAHNQRFYQQVESALYLSDSYRLWSRSRLEQRLQNGQPGVNWRLRQLMEWDLTKFTIKNKYRPFISEEVFLNLNQPSWVNQNVFAQNRAMVGVDFPCFSKHTCRVAYLNQFILQPPNNIMSHVLYTSLTL